MIPCIYIQEVAIGDRAFEAEGRLVHVRWLGFIFEITFAKVTRRFDG